MATFIITDLGNDIQIHRTGDIADSKYTFNKLSLRVKQTANQVLITNSDSFQSHKDNLVFELDYQKVTSPVYASNDELFSGLLGMISGVSLGSSGGGGGGNNTWSTAQGDFTATPTTATANITVTGLSWAFAEENVSSIVKYDSSGNKETLNTSQISVSGGVITLGNEDDFEAGDTVSVTLIGPDKAYDKSLDSNIVFVTNPEYAHYTSPEQLVDLTNTADATTSRYVIPFESYEKLSLHAKLVSGQAADTITVTFWATNNSAADDSADTDWVDISTTLFGGASISANDETTEGIYFLNDVVALKFMVKIVVAAGGTPANTTDIFIKKA